MPQQNVEELLKTLSEFKNRSSVFDPLRDVEEYHRYHQKIVVENWHFYLGLQQFYIRKYDSETDSEYINRVYNATVENQIGPIIDLMTSHLYGHPDSVKRYIKRNDSPDEELQKIINRVSWGLINSGTVDDKKALNTLVTGYTVIQRKFVDLRTNRAFPISSTPKEISQFGVISKTPLDSSFCLPLPYIDKETKSIDATRLGAILYIADVDTQVGNKIASELLGEAGQRNIKFSVIEYVDDDVWLKWIKEANSDKYFQQNMFPGTEYMNRNPFGNVNIPFTIYRNTGDPFYVEGDSDVKPLKSLNNELNELANGDRDVISYHQNPLLMGLNGADLPPDFRRTKNAFVKFSQKDQILQYLTWEGKLEASEKRQEEIRRVISNVSGISMISRGFLKEIGQIRSGPPLKALFTSDRSKMSRKFLYFKESEKQEMYADLRMYEFYSKKSLSLDNTVRYYCDFEDDFLGIDRLLEEEIRALQVQSGSEDHEEIIRAVHPEWDDVKVTETVKKIQAMKKEKSKPAKGGPSRSGEARAGDQA